MATRIPPGPEAVQLSRSLPSLARTREIEFALKFPTQRSAPSDRTARGLVKAPPSVVMPRTVEFCVVQNWSRIARRLPRLRMPSTERERKAAIWRRETFAVGS